MTNFDLLKKIKEPVFYITNDVAKGIGLETLLPNYHIVCLDDHLLVDYLLKNDIRVFCLERVLKSQNQIFRSTGKIIDHPLALEYIRKESGANIPNIMFFKPSAKIDFVCQKYGFNKIGNPGDLNRQFEDKVSFYERCLKEGIPVPRGETGTLGKMKFEVLAKKYNLPFVVQFGRGWAGSTTFFADKESDFRRLQEIYCEKKVKITEYILGKSILNNACIYKNKVLVSPPAVQIPSIKSWSSLRGATCGRQWPAEISGAAEADIFQLTQKIGLLMAKMNFRGFFGLDFLVEDKTDKVYLSENNARLTASAPFFSKLELEANRLPLIAYHLLSFIKNLKDDLFSPPPYLKSEIVGSEVVAKNNFNYQIKIKGKVFPGIYSSVKDDLSLISKDYFARNLSAGQCWLTAAAAGRVVNPEIEIVRINTKIKVLDKKMKIEPSVVSLVNKIKAELSLEKC